MEGCELLSGVTSTEESLITESALPDPTSTVLASTKIPSSLGPEPWKAPWWKAAEGDRATFFYLMAIHLLAVGGVIFFPTPGWKVAAATFALVWLGGLGVTVCYHRSLAHAAVRLHPVVRHTLIFFAMFALTIALISGWVLRGYLDEVKASAMPLKK